MVYVHAKTNRGFRAITNLVDRLLAVSVSEIQKRVEEHREQAAKSPNHRGAKPNRKPAQCRDGCAVRYF